MIPRRLIRIWLGPRKMRPFYHDWWSRFQELHPDWELRTITGVTPGRLAEPLQRIYDNCSTWAERADVLRWVVLDEIGGVFVDADTFPIKPLDPLLDDGCFLGFLTKTHRKLNNSPIGMEPGHPAGRAILEAFPEHYWEHANESPMISTGPTFVSPILMERDDVTCYPWTYFNGVGRCTVPEFERRCLESEDGYLQNFSAGSWWAEAKKRRETGKRAVLREVVA